MDTNTENTNNDTAASASVETKASPVTKRNKTRTVLSILKWVFFPIGLFVLLYNFLVKRFKLNITTKTTILYAVMFFVMFVSYGVFVIVNAYSAVANGLMAGYVIMIVIATVIFAFVYLALFISLGTFASQSMLKPIRKMIDKVDDITAEDMSARLDPVDSQDELMELTDCFNAMLDNLEESFARQRNFVSDASHELRTPISVIQGYSDLLTRWGKSDPQILDEAIEAIRAESANMKSIVEQLLYLARLGSFKPILKSFDLGEVVHDIVEAYDMTNVDKTIVTNIDKRINVVADRSLTVELIRIITDNAIKYTPPGGKVTISANAVKGGGAKVVITDNGIGISAEDLPHIFDRFYRCDKARGREKGSTGLGLSIAKSIIEMMGGRIVAQSTLGRGTSFTIELK